MCRDCCNCDAFELHGGRRISIIFIAFRLFFLRIFINFVRNPGIGTEAGIKALCASLYNEIVCVD